MHNGFWQANFPDLHGLPKSCPVAIFLCLLFFAPFECHSTNLATDPNTRFAVSTWAKCSIFWNTKRHGSPWSQFYPDLGGFDLWAETTQYGRGAGCDFKFLGHLHVSLNTYSIYHAWEQAVWMHYVCAKTAWSILWLACRGYYYGCAVGGCNYGGPHASRVISKNWTPCGKFWTYAFLTFAACKYAFLLCIFGYRFCIWHSWACAWTTTHKNMYIWKQRNGYKYGDTAWYTIWVLILPSM